MKKRLRGLLALALALTLAFATFGTSISGWADELGGADAFDVYDTDDADNVDDSDDDEDLIDENLIDEDLEEDEADDIVAIKMFAQAGEFNIGDIAVFNGIIDAMNLNLPQAPQDGSQVPGEWSAHVEWTGDDGDTDRRIFSLDLENIDLFDTLDVSELEELKILNCGNNWELTNIVFGDIDLFVLFCFSTQLSGTLDLSNMSSLYSLSAQWNFFTEVILHPDSFTNAGGNYINLDVNNLESEDAVIGKNINWNGQNFVFHPQRNGYYEHPAGTYNVGDLAVVNAIIDNNTMNGLALKKAYTANGFDYFPVSWIASENIGIDWVSSNNGYRIELLWMNSVGMHGVIDISELDELVVFTGGGSYGNNINGGITGLIVGEKNVKLEVLNFSLNQVTGNLDLRKLTNLRVLECSDNQLTGLDVSGLKKLEYIMANFNQFESIDVTGCKELWALLAVNSNLTALDLSTLEKLILLEIYGNNLTTLNVNMLPNIERLHVGGNKFKTLNLSALSKLQVLFATDNLLTEIILHSNAFTVSRSLTSFGVDWDFYTSDGFYLDVNNNYLASHASVKGKSGIPWDQHYFDEVLNDWVYPSYAFFAPQQSVINPPPPPPPPLPYNPPTILDNAETRSGQNKHFGTSANAPATWAAVSNEVTKLLESLPANTVAAGFNHVINTGADIIVPNAVFDTLKDTTATIMMNTGIGVTFSISGSNIPDGFDASSLDLTVRNGSLHAPNNIVREVTKGTITSLQIPMKSRDDFGMVINQHYNFGSANSNNYANLYKYNEQTREFEYMGSFQINEKGQAMFGFTKGADYLVTVTADRPNKEIMI
ncbi:MAG: hypothetical protein FWC09_05365 [Lachnospiraceae bacterium]|nr:hypothetical protein [Lachnospiraceae bacterium]